MAFTQRVAIGHTAVRCRCDSEIVNMRNGHGMQSTHMAWGNCTFAKSHLNFSLRHIPLKVAEHARNEKIIINSGSLKAGYQVNICW